MAKTVIPDQTLLQRLHIDFRWIVPHWVQVKERTDTNGYVDMWGVPYRATSNQEHYAVDGAPLAAAATPRDLEDFTWPISHDEDQFRGLRQQAKDLYEDTEYVVGADARSKLARDRRPCKCAAMNNSSWTWWLTLNSQMRCSTRSSGI